MTADLAWLSAADAARTLGVTRASLYAYVSRGLIRSQSAGRRSRERRYSREDVERLRRRTEERRDPDKAAARALQWGVPILESAITFIDGARLFYRGHDAIGLSRTASVADAAALIWGLDAPPVPGGGYRVPDGGSFGMRAAVALARAAAADPAALSLSPAGAAATGWQIVQVLAAAAGALNGEAPIEARLAHAWHVSRADAGLLRSALILCADHELNVSAFTARCIASAGSHPYAVVIGALSALEGPRHGGASARVEAMLESLRGTRRIPAALAERLRRGDRVDGFGHPLYRGGDPRAAEMLARLRERHARSRELAFVEEVAAAASAAARERPNLDFALAAVARVLRLPAGAPLMLFAIGRSIGWIGHAIEQYATAQLIRPRAKYTGPVPVNASR